MHANDACRIVITGIGLCTPLGSDRESTWRSLIAGRTATRWLTSPHWTEDSKLAGAPVCMPDGLDCGDREPLVELALATARESLVDARLHSDSLKSRNVGVVYGTSKGGLHTYARLVEQSRIRVVANSSESHERMPRLPLVSHDAEANADWLNVFPNSAASAIGQMVGAHGPVLCPVMACATGLAACLRGADLIRAGDCDVALVGSADVSLQPVLLGSFRRLGVLSREASEPQFACRPFDRHRSGFVVGEGAACLVLERLDSAIQRGASWYAEWLGGLTLSDSYSLTQLDPKGATLQRLLRGLQSINAQRPDYINLHGTGTATNDLIECQAINAVLKDAAARVDCSSLKGGMGHLLGAAGSVELAATAMSLRDQIIPPTVNLCEKDPGCALNLTPQVALSKPVEHAWKLSLGFGGHIAGASLARLESR